jgi:hypothetical protein
MSVPIRSIVTDPQGHVVALKLDGSIWRQHRIESGSGSYPTEWREIPGPEGRPVQLAVKHNGNLVCLDASGQLWEQAVSTGFGAPKWRPVELP